MSPSPVLQVRMTEPELVEWLEDRARRTQGAESAGVQARLELGTWRALLQLELRARSWEVGELQLLAQAVGGPVIDLGVADPRSVSPLYAELYDLTADTDPWGWPAAPARVLQLVEELTPTQEHAVRDALSRWWATHSDSREADAASFRRVGFIVD